MKRYFYAGGEKHELDAADDRLAVDHVRARNAGLSDLVDDTSPISKLPGGITLVDRAAFSSTVYNQLEAAGVVQPVYRSGSAFVVLRPEVRVELDPGQQDAALEAVKASSVASHVTGSSVERISLQPKSGSAEDALDLANFIYENARPAASSVRMLQVVAKPKSEDRR
ncbi:MAG: hypothetical protein ABJB74_11695 [Gemmatimonas sp.]